MFKRSSSLIQKPATLLCAFLLAAGIAVQPGFAGSGPRIKGSKQGKSSQYNRDIKGPGDYTPISVTTSSQVLVPGGAAPSNSTTATVTIPLRTLTELKRRNPGAYARAIVTYNVSVDYIKAIENPNSNAKKVDLKLAKSLFSNKRYKVDVDTTTGFGSITLIAKQPTVPVGRSHILITVREKESGDTHAFEPVGFAIVQLTH
jgi:hypothetical protein